MTTRVPTVNTPGIFVGSGDDLEVLNTTGSFVGSGYNPGVDVRVLKGPPA